MIKRITRFVVSISSVIKINIFSFYVKLINKKKVVFFYFPIKSYQANLIELIDHLKKEKNIEVILGYVISSSSEIKNLKNSFFLNLGYIRYLLNIDLFVTSYVVYSFPKAKNKIYISHDIYDAPMVNENVEENLIKTLKNYDYIFLSSEITIETLQKKIDLHPRNTFENKKTKLINTGYLKLDHVYQKVSKSKIEENSILLAPTLSSTLSEYNLNQYLDDLIKKILDYKQFRLIYRPHPGDIKNSEQYKKIMNIAEKFKNNKNFDLDVNTSYLESYKKSKFLITDFSGTAFTYAFSKLRPVLFISINENKLLNSNLNSLFYFKDREEVGKIIKNIDNLKEEIHSVNEQISFFSNKIKNLRSKRIRFFNSSIKQSLHSINQILKIEYYK